MKAMQPISVTKQTPSFVRSGFILSVSLIVVKIIGAFFKIPLMNLLSETGMAYFTGAYTVFTAIYALTVSGLTGACSKLTSGYLAVGAYADIRKLKKLSLLLYGGIGLCGTLCMLLGASCFARLIGCTLSAPAIMTAALAVLFCCLMAVYRGYFEGMQNMTPTAISQVAEAVGKLVFGLYGVYAVLSYAKRRFANGETVFSQTANTLSEAVEIALPYAAAAALFGITLSSLCGWICLLLFHRFQKPLPTAQAKPFRSGREICKELVKAAFPITISTAMLQLIPLIDTMTVMNLLTAYFSTHPTALTVLQQEKSPEIFCFGIFSACTTLFNLLPTAASLISKIALPAASGYDAAGDHQKQRAYMKAVLSATSIVMIPAACGMAAIAKPILTVVYAGQPYTAQLGASILQILSAAAICSGLLMPLTAFLQAGKSFWTPVICQMAGAVIKLLGNLLLIPRYGMSGAAYATLCGYLGALLVMLFVSRRRLGAVIPYAPFGKIVLLSGLMGYAAHRLEGILSAQSFSARTIVLLCMAAAIGIYLLGIFLCRPMTKKTLKMLMGKEKI